MKLIRLTSNDQNLHFNSFFNEDINIKADSKIALANLCFEKFEEKIIIDHTNNIIDYDNGGGLVDIYLEHGQYSDGTLYIFYADFTDKLNASLSIDRPTDIGCSFEVSLNENDKLVIASDYINQVNPLNSFTSINTDISNPLTIQKDSSTIAWDANIGSNVMECYDGLNGCGLFRLQIGELALTGEGFFIGLSETKPKDMNGDFSPSQCVYAIQAPNNGADAGHILTSSITTPGTGYGTTNEAAFSGGSGTGGTYKVNSVSGTSGIISYSITTEGIDYVVGDVLTFSHKGDSGATMTVGSVSSAGSLTNTYKFKNPSTSSALVTSTLDIETASLGNDDNDILSIEASEGMIQFVIYNASNPDGILLESATTGSNPKEYNGAKRLYPIIGFNQKNNTSIKNMSITAVYDPENDNNLGGVSSISAVSTLTPNDQDIGFYIKSLKFETLNIAEKLGFLTQTLSANISEFNFKAVNNFSFYNNDNSYIVLLDNIQLNSYDDFDPSGLQKGGRRNILRVVPDEIQLKILSYEPHQEYFIDINNPEDLLLRNFKIRVVNSDLTPVKSVNLSTLSLLIKGPDEK